jgi:predicted GIY-YIG superfamily endonuclease
MFVVPAKAGTQGHSCADDPEAPMRLHPREPTEWYSLYRRDQRSRAPHLAAPVKCSGRLVREYEVHRLAYVEFHNTMEAAILREKRLKEWRRAWNLELIERHNPQWWDLYDELAISGFAGFPAFARTTTITLHDEICACASAFAG